MKFAFKINLEYVAFFSLLTDARIKIKIELPYFHVTGKHEYTLEIVLKIRSDDLGMLDSYTVYFRLKTYKRSNLKK